LARSRFILLCIVRNYNLKEGGFLDSILWYMCLLSNPIVLELQTHNA